MSISLLREEHYFPASLAVGQDHVTSLGQSLVRRSEVSVNPCTVPQFLFPCVVTKKATCSRGCSFKWQ